MAGLDPAIHRDAWEARLNPQISSLQGIEPGAFFFAEGDFARAICLVTSADSVTVRARVITIQLDLEFDVATGFGNCEDGDYPCKVVSVGGVPEDVLDSFLSIDRKYRLLNAPEGTKLLKHEIDALLFFRFPDDQEISEKIQKLDGQLDQQRSLFQGILLSRFQRHG